MASIDDARTYMEDADDDGNPIDDTKTYVSTAPSIKEEANVSRTRRESLRRKDSSSPAAANLHTDSDSTAHQRSPLKRDSKRSKEKSRDKDRPSGRKTVTHGARPGAKSAKTAPNIHTSSLRKPPQDQSSFYGVSPTGTSPLLMAANSNSTRPRAYTASQRPHSYYMHPPMPPQANTRYYQHAHPAPGTSYPPQSPFLPPPSAPPPYPSAFPPPSPFVPPQGDYFSSNLSSRFGPYLPPSNMTRPAITYGPGYEEQEEGGALVRQASLMRRRSTRQHEDRVRMAPPLARPNTTRPPATSGFAPPSKRRSIESLRDDESLDETEYLYNDGTPPEQYEYRPHPVRRPSIDSTVYDMGPRFAEIAGRRGRRNSHYEGRNHSTERDVEEKYREALRYQQDLAEGPIDPLTTDSLRRLTKTPSGGTKSSGSRDESGYGRSAATTRTSVDNDDITILVKNAGQLSLGNALLDFQGAEIIVRTGNSGGGGTSGGSDRHSHGGSDNISSAYDDRRTRFERPSIRGRANSQAGSHSRGFPFQPQQQPQSQSSPQADYSGNPYFPTQYPPPYPYPYQY